MCRQWSCGNIIGLKNDEEIYWILINSSDVSSIHGSVLVCIRYTCLPSSHWSFIHMWNSLEGAESLNNHDSFNCILIYFTKGNNRLYIIVLNHHLEELKQMVLKYIKKPLNFVFSLVHSFYGNYYRGYWQQFNQIKHLANEEFKVVWKLHF